MIGRETVKHVEIDCLKLLLTKLRHGAVSMRVISSNRLQMAAVVADAKQRFLAPLTNK